MQRYEEALADINTVIAQEPQNAIAIINRGQIYFRLRDYEKTFADFNRAVAIKPELKWLVLGNQGQTYLWMRRYQEALAAFNKSIKNNPKFVYAHYYQFVTYEMLKQPDKAQNSLAEAIKLSQKEYDQNPSSDDNIRLLALFHVAAGDVKKAEPLYQKFLSGKTSVYTIRLAIRDLNDFLNFFPDNQDAKSMRDLLQNHLQSKSNSR